MKSIQFHISFFCFWLMLSGPMFGCINLSLGGAKKEKSNSITVSAPTAPYETADSKHVDQGWIHPKNGSTISYLSDCGDSADVSLKQMELMALNGLYNLKIMDQADLTFSERKALRTKAQGEVDGVLVNVDLLVLKKNGCRYTFTLTGFPQTFSQAQNDFNQFLKGVSIQ